MNRIKYIWGILIVLCCLQACYDDNSRLADQPIIEVNILPTAKDSINIYFNNTLEIKADIESETPNGIINHLMMGYGALC